MKILIKIIIIISIVITFIILGSYFYFDKKFTPSENYLIVSNNAENIQIKWIEENENKYSALLLPIRFTGIDYPLYMQLDFGAPTTVFYNKPLESINKKYPRIIQLNEDLKTIKFNFRINEMQVSSDKFRLLNFGNYINFTNPKEVNIIGTLGTDLLEKRIIDMDFNRETCSFTENIDEKGFSDFKFNKRRILLPAYLENKKMQLLFDSGTSGYELITDKENWNKLRTPTGKIKTDEGKSWGKILKVFTAPAKETIQIGSKKLNLSEVTYIEGTSHLQNFLMKSSGMNGMIGNKIFLKNRIVIDCKSEKFKIE